MRGIGYVVLIVSLFQSLPTYSVATKASIVAAVGDASKKRKTPKVDATLLPAQETAAAKLGGNDMANVMLSYILFEKEN